MRSSFDGRKKIHRYMNITAGRNYLASTDDQEQCIIQNTHWLSGFYSKYYKFRNV